MNDCRIIRQAALELHATDDNNIVKIAGIISRIRNYIATWGDPAAAKIREKIKTEGIRVKEKMDRFSLPGFVGIPDGCEAELLRTQNKYLWPKPPSLPDPFADFLPASFGTLKNDIATLDIGFDIDASPRLHETGEFFHGNDMLAPDIDAAQECDPGFHGNIDVSHEE